MTKKRFKKKLRGKVSIAIMIVAMLTSQVSTAVYAMDANENAVQETEASLEKEKAEEVLSEEITSEEEKNSEEVVPEETAPEEAVSEETTLDQGNLVENVVNEEVVSETKTVSKEAVLESTKNAEITPYVLNTGHRINVRFCVLYVDSKYNIGYNFGASESTTFVCQYSVAHSDTAYNNHTIAISDIRAAASRLSVDAGYSITGWTKSASANPNIFSLDLSGTTACNKGDTIYLVAKGKEKTFYLHYNANGGSGAPSSQSATSTAASYNFSISNTRPVREEYDFLGWSTSSTDTSPSYYGGGTINVSSSTTLYAVWKAKTYTVTYTDGVGQTAFDNQVYSGLVKNAITPGFSGIPLRKGYTFIGWNPSVQRYVTSNVTYEAMWKKNPVKTTYKVEWYDTEGNKIKETETRSATAGDDVAVTKEDKLVVGYTFDADNEGNHLSDKAAEDGSTVLKLYFEKDPEPPVETTYKVQWYDVDGKLIKEEERSATAGEDVEVKESDKILEGYTFDADNEGNHLSDKAVEDGSTVLKLYFEKDPEPSVETTYKVQWYDVDGKLIKEEERSATAGEDVEVKESDKILEGYTFDADNEGNHLSDKVAEDGSTVLKLYFEKDSDPENPDKPDPENPDKPDPENPDKPDPENPDNPNLENPDNSDKSDLEKPNPTDSTNPDNENNGTPANNAKEFVKTGDHNPIMAYSIVAILAMAVILSCFFSRRKRNEEL